MVQGSHASLTLPLAQEYLCLFFLHIFDLSQREGERRVRSKEFNFGRQATGRVL
jgi:hypothetical protein